MYHILTEEKYLNVYMAVMQTNPIAKISDLHC